MRIRISDTKKKYKPVSIKNFIKNEKKINESFNANWCLVEILIGAFNS